MSDTAWLIISWAIAIGIWAGILIPESSRFAAWLRAMFNVTARPIRWATSKVWRQS